MADDIQTPTVVFVDVLGFAAQVLKDDAALGLLDAFYNSSHSFDALRRQLDEHPHTVGIERLFGLFHVGLEEEVALALKASHLHSIVFSDSAFIAFEWPIDALVFCQRVMRKMISGCVPVRIGVAQGSFKPLRFKTDLGRNITLHSSYFLGSGVVRAHAAESSGVAGLRILLHQNFPIPPGFELSEVLPLTAPADPDDARMRRFEHASTIVDRELIYLNPHISLRALPDDLIENDRINQGNRSMYANVLALRTQSHVEVQYHYDDTAKAIECMRTQLSLPSLLTE